MYNITYYGAVYTICKYNNGHLVGNYTVNNNKTGGTREQSRERGNNQGSSETTKRYPSITKLQ